jgi:hypothetical protein
MPVEAVTIKAGPADLCAAPIGVNNSVTGMTSNAIEAICLVIPPTLYIKTIGYANNRCVLLQNRRCSPGAPFWSIVLALPYIRSDNQLV